MTVFRTDISAFDTSDRFARQVKEDAAFNAATLKASGITSDAAQTRTDAEAERERFIKATEQQYRGQAAAGGMARSDFSGPTDASSAAAAAAARTAGATQPVSAEKVLASELAKLVPGLALEGRSLDFLRTALRVAHNEPYFRTTPLQLEERALHHLATEFAYLSDAGGRAARG